MILDDLKDRLKGDFASFLDKVQESSIYVSLKDRFDSLSPGRQRLVSLAIAGLIICVLFMMPLMTYWNSTDTIAEYEGRRDLIRELLRANKEANENMPNFVLPSVADVENQVRVAMTQLQLLPEQTRGVQAVPSAGGIIKASLVDSVVEVSTVQLNLRQVVLLGTSFVRIQGTKLKDLIMTANPKDPRYYDAIYRIVVFKPGGGDAGGSQAPGVRPPGGGVPPPPPPPGARNRQGG